MIIRKRDGKLEVFQKEKIHNAIKRASEDKDVHDYERIFQGDIASLVEDVIHDLGGELDNVIVNIEDVQNSVELVLMREGYYSVAKHYITYRHDRGLARKFNKRDESILSLISGDNSELSKENSNKNPKLASTMRDYMAGEVSKDLAKRLLLPKDLVEAHEKGMIHYHDMDYSPAMPIFNCCLVNIKDMLDNGTCINGTMVDSPSSFTTACTVMTQIIAQIASSQYGKVVAVVKPI